MTEHSTKKIIPIAQALFVTFLWSTSFIIIKWGLIELPALTYAGLRYALAFICFIPFLFTKVRREQLKQISKVQWKQLFGLGIVYYTLTQGLMFLGISLLPPASVSLILNFTPLIVAGMAKVFLGEHPVRSQWIGTAIFLAGILIYFVPFTGITAQVAGLGVMVLGVLANAVSAVMGRDINRGKAIDPLIITAISMGFGSVILLTSGVAVYGVPAISGSAMLNLFWLATVNTAFAFYLWNVTLRTLSAIESSIINGTMLIQISVLAWYFLDQPITLTNGIGIIIATAGVVLVQLKPGK